MKCKGEETMTRNLLSIDNDLNVLDKIFAPFIDRAFTTRFPLNSVVSATNKDGKPRTWEQVGQKHEAKDLRKLRPASGVRPLIKVRLQGEAERITRVVIGHWEEGNRWTIVSQSF